MFSLGFLNINGLVDGNHSNYLNEDKNLLQLHILVLSETKLDSSFETSKLLRFLSNWDIIAGMMLMTTQSIWGC